MWCMRVQGGDASPENYCEEPAVSESEHRNLSTCIIPSFGSRKMWLLGRGVFRNIHSRECRNEFPLHI